MVEIPVVENDPWWTNYVTGFRLGDTLVDTWGVEPKLAFTDSGTSCLHMDSNTFDFFIKELEKHSTHGLNQDSSSGQYRLNNCQDKGSMPNVSLLYGGHWFEMFVDDYIYESKGVCKICIYGQGGPDSRWIIGNSFMRGYYVAHDYDRLSFGIAPQDNRYKSKGYAGDYPYKVVRSNTWILKLCLGLFFTSFSGLLGVALLLPSVSKSGSSLSSLASVKRKKT